MWKKNAKDSHAFRNRELCAMPRQAFNIGPAFLPRQSSQSTNSRCLKKIRARNADTQRHMRVIETEFKDVLTSC